MRWSTNPLSQVARVRKRDTASDDTSLDICLSGDVPRPRQDNFVSWTHETTDVLNLVSDQEANRLDVLALTPSP